MVASAAARRPPQVVEILLSQRNGLQVDSRDVAGWTPLVEAAFKGALPIVEALLRAKADPRHKTVAGWTALHEAASRGHAPVCAALLAAKAELNTLNLELKSPLDVAAEKNKVAVPCRTGPGPAPSLALAHLSLARALTHAPSFRSLCL